MRTLGSGNASGGDPPAGVILAGGRSRRMGGGHKSLELLAGRPMLQCVIDRVAPQVGDLALSVERASSAWAAFGLPQLVDPRPGEQGPLGGLLAAMRRFSGRAGWLLLVPCDAPFLPRDLAPRLLSSVGSSDAGAVSAVFEGELQPTFSLWRLDLLPRVEAIARANRQAGLKFLLRALPAAYCEWRPAPAGEGTGSQPPPFFNINERADLDQARVWLKEIGIREANEKC